MTSPEPAPGFWQASHSDFPLNDPVDMRRSDLFDRFDADPLARHDVELQQLVSTLRGHEGLPRYVLLTEPGGYRLAVAPRRRGEALRLVSPRVFSTQAAVERFVFNLRLAALSSPHVPPPDTGPVTPAKSLLGYADELSVRPGDAIKFHVSGDPADGSYDISIVRLLGGGTHPAGPALTTAFAADLGSFPIYSQPVAIGSYGTAQLDDRTVQELAPAGIVKVRCRPTGPMTGPVTLLEVSGLFRLGLDGSGHPFLELGEATVHLDEALAPGRWHRLEASWTATGESSLTTGVTTARSKLGSAPLHAGNAELTLGARRFAGTMTEHFAGYLEAPALYSAVREDSPLSAWDFSRDLSSWTVPGHGAHPQPLILHGAPRRAVRGEQASGETKDWRESSTNYTAIHLYPDGLDDAGWKPQARWNVPADAPSGFYAAKLSTNSDSDWIPFFIRPAENQPPAPVLVIASSATYASYANSRFWWEDPIQEVAQDRLVALGQDEQFLVGHSEFGLSCYDLHGDGTPVVFSSRRRPNLFMRPGHPRGESYASDLYLIGWLQQLGIDYDVITDEDLHAGGDKALTSHRVVISGTHPEYLSEEMFDAMHSWVEAGGRYLYLGGNGFTSTVTWSTERPWLMENRTTGRARAEPTVSQYESHHQADGSPGKPMEQSGRAPHTLFGVDSVTMGFDRAYPATRTPESYAPEFTFAFEGIDGRFLGGRSLSGAGVIGQEWDNARNVTDARRHHVLARSTDHSLIPAVLGADTPYHGDVVLKFLGSGAVFSASSMAWVGGLHIDNYANDTERFTRNILLRFLDPRPIAEPTAGLHDNVERDSP